MEEKDIEKAQMEKKKSIKEISDSNFPRKRKGVTSKYKYPRIEAAC